MRGVLRVPVLAPPSASEAPRALVLARLVAYEAIQVPVLTLRDACGALRAYFLDSLGAYGAPRWNPSLVGYRLIYAVPGPYR